MSDPQQLAMEFEAVQQRLRQVDAQMAALEGELHETQRALRTLEGLEAGDGLVPIGAGFHIRATLHADTPVVTPVGAGYAADQSRDAAVAALKERAAETQQLLQRVEQEADKLAHMANEMAQKLQQ